MPGMLQSMESQRAEHDWATELKGITICLKSVSVINQIHVHICGLHGLGDTTPNQYAFLYVSVPIFHSSGFYLLHFSAWCLLFCCCLNLQTGQMSKKISFSEDQLFFFFFFFFNIYLFIFGCAESLLLCGLFSHSASGGNSLVAACRLLIVVSSLTVEHRLSVHRLQ